MEALPCSTALRTIVTRIPPCPHLRHHSGLRPIQRQAARPAPGDRLPADLAGIAHVALRASTNLGASRAFYEKLGFTSPFNLTRDGAVYRVLHQGQRPPVHRALPRGRKRLPARLPPRLLRRHGPRSPPCNSYVSRGLTPTAVRKEPEPANLLFTIPGPTQIGGAPEGIEYTQYLPGSQHSSDFGKDLGTDRVGNELFLLPRLLVMQRTPASPTTSTPMKLGFTSDNPTNPLHPHSPPAPVRPAGRIRPRRLRPQGQPHLPHRQPRQGAEAPSNT